MDFAEKAAIRIDHWIRHNEDHLKEYESFAEELEAEGNHETAAHIREMATLMTLSTRCLHRASETLGAISKEESHV